MHNVQRSKGLFDGLNLEKLMLERALKWAKAMEKQPCPANEYSITIDDLDSVYCDNDDDEENCVNCPEAEEAPDHDPDFAEESAVFEMLKKARKEAENSKNMTLQLDETVFDPQFVDIVNQTLPVIEKQHRKWQKNGFEDLLNSFDVTKLQRALNRYNESENNKNCEATDRSSKKLPSNRNVEYQTGINQYDSEDSLSSSDVPRYIRSSRGRTRNKTSTTTTIKTFRTTKNRQNLLRLNRHPAISDGLKGKHANGPIVYERYETLHPSGLKEITEITKILEAPSDCSLSAFEYSFDYMQDAAQKQYGHRALDMPYKSEKQCKCYKEKKLCGNVKHIANFPNEQLWYVGKCDSPKSKYKCQVVSKTSRNPDNHHSERGLSSERCFPLSIGKPIKRCRSPQVHRIRGVHKHRAKALNEESSDDDVHRANGNKKKLDSKDERNGHYKKQATDIQPSDSEQDSKDVNRKQPKDQPKTGNKPDKTSSSDLEERNVKNSKQVHRSNGSKKKTDSKDALKGHRKKQSTNIRPRDSEQYAKDAKKKKPHANSESYEYLEKTETVTAKKKCKTDGKKTTLTTAASQSLSPKENNKQKPKAKPRREDAKNHKEDKKAKPKKKECLIAHNESTETPSFHENIQKAVAESLKALEAENKKREQEKSKQQEGKEANQSGAQPSPKNTDPLRNFEYGENTFLNNVAPVCNSTVLNNGTILRGHTGKPSDLKAGQMPKPSAVISPALVKPAPKTHVEANDNDCQKVSSTMGDNARRPIKRRNPISDSSCEIVEQDLSDCKPTSTISVKRKHKPNAILIYSPEDQTLAPSTSFFDGYFILTEEHLRGVMGEKAARRFLKLYQGRRRFKLSSRIYYRPPKQYNSNERLSTSSSDCDLFEVSKKIGEIFEKSS